MNDEIKNLIQTYQCCLNEANLELVRAVYNENAVFIGQGYPTANGIDEIVDTYAGFLSELDFDIQFDILEIALTSEFGFVRTRSYGTIVPKGQAPEEGVGSREIFIVKKINGNWKIYIYIFNDDF